MAPKKKTYYYLTEEDKNTLNKYRKEIDEMYYKAQEKKKIIEKKEKEEKKKRDAEIKKRQLEIQRQKIRDKIEAFPKKIEQIKKFYFENIFIKNDNKLIAELKEFSRHCIHPKVFETTKKIEVEKECGGGQGVSYSTETVNVCGLCRSCRVSQFSDYIIEPGHFINIVKEYKW